MNYELQTDLSPASRIKASLTQLFEAKLSPGEPYLRFQFSEMIGLFSTSEITGLLSMKNIQESLIVTAEKITPIPNMPKSVMGIMSSRDRVFCVFDLAQILGLPSKVISARQYHIIVLEISQQLLLEQKLHIGLCVTKLQGITRLTSAQIKKSLDFFPSNIAGYLGGYVEEEGEKIPVFSLLAIASEISRK